MNIIKYDNEAAVRYAYAWAYSRNPKYHDFSGMGGNCTNFVSQCLVAGGMPMNQTYLGWFYKSLNSRSPSFTGAHYLHNFLTQKVIRRGPFANLAAAHQAKIGDIIQLSFDGIYFTHSVIVVQTDFQNPLVAANSYDVYGKPLDLYTYRESRTLKILGAFN